MDSCKGFGCALDNLGIGTINFNAYLKRIGYRGPLRPSVEVLRTLHREHLLAIPFENLDIHLGRPIVLSEAAFYDKMIRHRRGGFCYELNGSFAALLKRLGFRVSLLSAMTATEEGGFSPDFDHMTLLVRLRERWLADVGFGDSFAEPKLLDRPGPQEDNGRVYCITRKSDGRLLSKWDVRKNSWKAQYLFTLRSRKLEDFVPRCLYQQNSPDSHFRQGPFCTRLTPTGRVTLTRSKFIVTRGNRRLERPLRNPEEFDKLLRRQFAINLG